MIRTKYWLLLAASMLFALDISDAQANPDVWVKSGMTYRFEDGKITGITFDWQFDEFFSSRTIATYDADQSGVLELAEVNRLRGEAFDPLSEFGYYVHVWVAGKKWKDLEIEKFSASIDGILLVYRFTVALTPPADPGAGDIVVSLYDKSIYVDFVFLEKNFLLTQGVMNPGCKFRIARGRGAQSGHRRPVTLKCGG